MTEAERVVLVPSDHARWKSKFEQMAVQLGAILPGLDVEHIGSTSVPGVPAKDVVDLMIGVDCARNPAYLQVRCLVGFAS
nr:GrpB family protein [Micrococcus terreus]MDK7700812.1 GrpB family protein [Micrococcus terreus]